MQKERERGEVQVCTQYTILESIYYHSTEETCTLGLIKERLYMNVWQCTPAWTCTCATQRLSRMSLGALGSRLSILDFRQCIIAATFVSSHCVCVHACVHVCACQKYSLLLHSNMYMPSQHTPSCIPHKNTPQTTQQVYSIARCVPVTNSCAVTSQQCMQKPLSLEPAIHTQATHHNNMTCMYGTIIHINKPH